MNKNLYRTQFDQMETTEKQALMESLDARYTMTFLGLHTFERWGQSFTTGIFEKDGREFVFVPGDTVTLGWEQFAVGLNQESREELEYLFREWEMEQDPAELIGESMAPVRQAAIGPMLAGWAHFLVSYPVRPTVSRKCKRTMNETEIMTFIGLSFGWRTMIDNRSLIQNKEREVPTWEHGA